MTAKHMINTPDEIQDERQLMKQWSSKTQNPSSTNIKPLEIYLFIDPFCTDCWSLGPIIKKLQLEYGDYFTIKYVLCGKLTSLNSKNGNYHWKRNDIKTNKAFIDY